MAGKLDATDYEKSPIMKKNFDKQGQHNYNRKMELCFFTDIYLLKKA